MDVVACFMPPISSGKEQLEGVEASVPSDAQKLKMWRENNV